MTSIYIFDPTAKDSQSKVRGIGRYMQVLHEQFEHEWTFTSDLKNIPFESNFINPFFNCIAPPLITKRIAKRQIAVIHDLIPLKYPQNFPIGLRGKINVYRNKKALKQYDAIVTDSEASKKDIVSILKIDAQKIHVIYPIVANIFEEKSRQSTERMHSATSYCVYVGDATWNKNLVTLAKAIKIADISCVFVGKVFLSRKEIQKSSHLWQKELHEFFEITKDDHRFVFPGFIPDDALVDLYKNAFCNILVSRDEGFGFSFLEAAALGVPSILSDIPVLRETAESSAVFVNPNDAQNIAEKLKEFQSNGTTQKHYAEAAQIRSSYFSNDRFKNTLQSLLQ